MQRFLKWDIILLYKPTKELAMNEQQFDDFCQFARNLVGTKNYTIDIAPGNKFMKLIKTQGDHHSVWCFVDKSTGEIFKPASFKAPAKHARGNVADPDSYKGYSWTGPPYLV